MTQGESNFGRELLAAALDGTPADEQPLRHVTDLAPRQARRMPWPTWVGADVTQAFTDRGVAQPWSHQVSAAELAHAGRHVVIATGTASGKSLAYQLPILHALHIDPIWYAIILTVNMTMALITPPVGMNLYVINGLRDDIHMSEVITGVWPFVLIIGGMLVLTMIFPMMSTWLPSVM